MKTNQILTEMVSQTECVDELKAIFLYMIRSDKDIRGAVIKAALACPNIVREY